MTRCRDDQLEVATMPKVATWASHPSSGGSSYLSCFDIVHALAFFGMLGWTWWPRHSDSGLGSSGSGSLVYLMCGPSQGPVFATVFRAPTVSSTSVSTPANSTEWAWFSQPVHSITY